MNLLVGFLCRDKGGVVAGRKWDSWRIWQLDSASLLCVAFEKEGVGSQTVQRRGQSRRIAASLPQA